MEKDFDRWNQEKKITNQSKKCCYRLLDFA